jgi:hypothetical protein
MLFYESAQVHNKKTGRKGETRNQQYLRTARSPILYMTWSNFSAVVRNPAVPYSMDSSFTLQQKISQDTVPVPTLP